MYTEIQSFVSNLTLPANKLYQITKVIREKKCRELKQESHNMIVGYQLLVK